MKCHHTLGNLTMKTLEALRKEAEASANAHGHILVWATPWHSETKSLQEGKCITCGTMVDINTRPMANGIDIAGEAVACDCISNTDSPCIYVACLAACNADTLPGRWINATQGEDHIREEVAAMLNESLEAGAKEWAILDAAGFGPIFISEHEDLATVAQLAKALEDKGEAFGLFWNFMGYNRFVSEVSASEALSSFEYAYCGKYTSEEAYAYELVDEMGELEPDSLASTYFDYEAYARDLFMSDRRSEQSKLGGVHVFRPPGETP